MIAKLIAKAKQALATGRRDLNAGDFDAAVNRSYYAAFYAAWAMFAAEGIDKPKTHSGLISEFSRRFVKNGPLDRTTGTTLGKLENLRSYADYVLACLKTRLKTRLSLPSLTRIPS
ncbi:MAG: HEPN domain-containing protein [Gammaproteobacteria bacterium]